VVRILVVSRANRKLPPGRCGPFIRALDNNAANVIEYGLLPFIALAGETNVELTVQIPAVLSRPTHREERSSTRGQIVPGTQNSLRLSQTHRRSRSENPKQY
jgi:hypothetical protein